MFSTEPVTMATTVSPVPANNPPPQVAGKRQESSKKIEISKENSSKKLKTSSIVPTEVPMDEEQTESNEPNEQLSNSRPITPPKS